MSQPAKTEATVITAAAATTSQNSSDQTSNDSTGVMLYVDFTATPNNTETITPSIQVKDPTSGKYQTLTTFTALTSSSVGATPTTETYLYTLYPGGAETVATGHHEVQALPLPKIWRIRMVHSASTAWTYTVGLCYLI